MPQKSVNLANIFQAVTQSLAENQQVLNQADEYNGDHGSNMVQTFATITEALLKKKGSSVSTALNYASRQLAQKSTSGSAKLYAENLAQAATRFKGKSVDSRGAMELLQTLIGGGQAAQSTGQGGDLLGALLGGMMGGEASPQQQVDSSGGGDLLGALLGGLMGGEASPQQQAGSSGGGDLLGALLGGMMGGGSTAQQSSAGGGDLISMLLGSLLGGGGGGGLQTLIQAFLGKSRMGDSPYRTQSTELVVDSFLKALSSTLNK